MPTQQVDMLSCVSGITVHHVHQLRVTTNVN